MLGSCDSRDMVVLGDSVGGHLAIASSQMAIQEKLPQPVLIIALSPWIDFGDFLPGKAEREQGDPIIGMVSLHKIPEVWCGNLAQKKTNNTCRCCRP